MGIYTYFSDNDQERYAKVSDKELDDVLQEVRRNFANEYYIKEFITYRKRFLRKSIRVVKYELFHTDNGFDARVINFAQNHDWSINTYVDKSYILSYLFGLLSGRAYVYHKYSNIQV